MKKTTLLYAAGIVLVLSGCSTTPDVDSITPTASKIVSNEGGYGFDGTFGGRGYGFGTLSQPDTPVLSERLIIRGLLNDYASQHYADYSTIYGWYGRMWDISYYIDFYDIIATDGIATCYYTTYTLPFAFQAEGETSIVPAGQTHHLYGYYNKSDNYFSFSASL